MTKCIVLGELPKEEKKKPIVFEMSLIGGPISFKTRMGIKPKEYGHIELVCKNYLGAEIDLMFAYNTLNRNTGTLYIGQWNDGVSE